MSRNTKMGLRRVANARESSEFYQERRREIMRKAAEVFLEVGYEGATIQDIAERLGTDRASLYYYVGSKQELFQHVVREAATTNIQAIEVLANARLPASEKLHLAFTGLMESFDRTFPYLHVFMQENFYTLTGERDKWGKEVREWSKRYYNAMHKIVKQGSEEGEFTLQLPVGLTTMALIGTINWAHRWYRPGRGDMQAGDIGSGFADILLNGLLSKRKRRPPGRDTAKLPNAAD